MGMSYDVTGGFGIKITPEEMEKLASDYTELLGRECSNMYPFESEDEGGFLKLPDGFQYAKYSDYYDERGFIVCVKNTALNAVMRGESPPPDFKPLLAWIDEHKIQVESRIPEIHYLLFVS
jgi:hypothetical protein